MFKNFIFDVDGVFTDGKFHYSAEGKIVKVFGDADNDALSLLSSYMHIEMVTGDKRGFAISQKRIQEDMGYPLSLVSTFERAQWISNKFDSSETVYMGDGIYDPLVFKQVGYSIAPANAFVHTKKHANYVTLSKGGEGAVAEAVIYVFENLLNMPFDIFTFPLPAKSGNWEKKF
jgi:3-deoxy-D-manno-octulosonate 8-phosphate phosphatase (KDO 8-P phosphatase)